MKELIFQVENDIDGGYFAFADALNGRITTQGDTIAELKEMIVDAVQGFYFDKPELMPKISIFI